jgi:hypothetical protein
MANLKLEEVTSEKDFDQIWPVLFDAFEKPYNSFFQFFNPIHGMREEAIQVSKGRHIQTWKNDPDCHWLKVTDTNTNEIIGAACWEVHEKTPEPSSASPNASWHIEGSEEKAFAEKLLGGLKGFIGERMMRPHLGT